MKRKMDLVILGVQEKARNGVMRVLTRKHEGADKILVTVGLCIIALLLIVVLKDQLSTFISTLCGKMLTKAEGILGS